MTHNELLATIDWIGKAKDGESGTATALTVATLASLNALRAVVELHKPFNVDTDKPLCPRCMEPDFSHKGNPILVMASYPCLTIQAIEKVLS